MSTAALAPTSASEALLRIDAALDLSRVRAKLLAGDDGPGSDALDVMEAEYRRFLALQIAYPATDIVPCKIVDKIWHQHILDTRAYRADCDSIFGHFVDHDPYFGMCDAQQAQELTAAYHATLDRYRHEFGEPPAGTWLVADDATCKTQTGCRPEP